MTEVTPAVKQSEPSNGSRRRLAIIVGIGFLALLTFLVATAYAEGRANDEDLRVQRVAATLTIDPTDLVETAYGSSDAIARAFGVSSERVSMAIGGSNSACIAVRSEYFASNRTSFFAVGDDGRLTPASTC
ncbi:MAG: hypothetical protein ACOYMR_10145 [Ilumatobacteraceae bacterium]